MDLSGKESAIFKAFCDENRIIIIQHISQGEKCACELIRLTGMKQSRLAYHMKILCDSGIIRARHDGTWIRYTINQENARAAAQLIYNLTKTKP
mgnify:CR=1 FL=1